MTTTTLGCLSWMQNQKDQDPCTIAQNIGRLCNSQYTVSLTDFQESKYVPNTTTPANGCTCSWSIYNLLSACSYCVGQRQYTSWGTWVTNCGSLASNTSYLPSGLRISQGIPFWAATNPSTWENAVFNVTKAADIAAGAHSDVTGGSLPTSTSAITASSSGVSVRAIVGGVIAAFVIITIGALIIFLGIRRHRKAPTATSFTASQPPQPAPIGYSYVPPRPLSPRVTSSVRSTTSLATTSPLASPISSGFSSQAQSATHPITDAADMISPFLLTSPGHQTERSDTSLPRTNRPEARSARTSPTERRVRLNPPPYSPPAEPGSVPSRVATAVGRRLSTRKQKKRNDSVSGSTTYSGHSRTSTKGSITAILAGPRMEQSRPRAATSGARTVV